MLTSSLHLTAGLFLARHRTDERGSCQRRRAHDHRCGRVEGECADDAAPHGAHPVEGRELPLRRHKAKGEARTWSPD
eukprot:7390364-Prymnesium_polylepis.1